MRKKGFHELKSVVNVSNESEQSQRTTSPDVSSPSQTVLPSTSSFGSPLARPRGRVAAHEVPVLPEETFHIIPSQPPKSTVAAGTALSEARSTLPFNPPLRPTSAPAQPTTIESIMSTDCVFCDASGASVDGLLPLPESSLLGPETSDTAAVSASPIPSSASTAVTSTPTIAAQPENQGLPAVAIVFIALAFGLSLACVVVLLLLIRRRQRRRQRLQDKKPCRFWCRLFCLRSSPDPMIPPSELQQIPAEAAAPSSLPHPSNFADSYSATGSKPPPLALPANPPPNMLIRMYKKAVNAIKSAFEPAPLIPPSPGLRQGFSYAFVKWEEKREKRETEARRRARAKAKKHAAAAAAADARSVSVDLGVRGEEEAASEMVEIVLDEELALDELERTTREQRATWDAARASLSPFPQTRPSMAIPRPSGVGTAANSALEPRAGQREIEMNGGDKGRRK